MVFFADTREGGCWGSYKMEWRLAIFLIIWSFLLRSVNLPVIDTVRSDFFFDKIYFCGFRKKLTTTLNVCFISADKVAAKFSLEVYLNLCIRMLSCINLDRRSVITMSIIDILRSIQITTERRSSNSLRKSMFSVLSVEISS